MVAARKQWESQTLLAIKKSTRVGLPKKVTKLAREASILPMMAYDGFRCVLALCVWVIGCRWTCVISNDLDTRLREDTESDLLL